MTSPVPGKPAYRYGHEDGQTGIFKWTQGPKGGRPPKSNAEAEDAAPVEDGPTLQLVLDWYPRVLAHIVRLDSRKKIMEARYTIEIDGRQDTLDAAELADAAAWQKWPGAVGVHDRVIREVLAIIVQAEARKHTMIADAPYWDGDKLILPDSDLLPRGYGEKYRNPGEVEELLRLAIANPKLALIIGTSYAAPYVEPLGRQPFWLALGGTSSKGKTTGLLAGACLHGRPGKKGLNRSWNNSTNGVNILLGQLSVMPLFLDEIHMAGFTPVTLKKAVHQTCDGADRFTSSRRKKLSDTPPWYGVLFSTGNISVTGWCPQPEIAVRVVEIPAPIVDTSDTSKRVQDLALSNYGWWQEVPMDVMRQAIAKAENLIGLPEEGGAEERIVENLALGVAGAAIVGTLVLGKEGGGALGQAALSAARDLLAIQVDELADSGQTPSERLLEEIRQSIVSRPARWPSEQDYREWLKATKATSPDQPGRPVALDIWGFHEDGRVEVITKFMDELARAAGLENPRIALRELKESEALKVGTEGGRLRQKSRVPGTRFSVYVIDLNHEETSKGAKSTGTTGTTGTTEDVSAVQIAHEAWSRWPEVPEPTGTTGTSGTSETPGEEGGPGGGPAQVVPLNRRDRDRAAARTDLGEQAANMARLLARDPRWDPTDEEVMAAVKCFNAAMRGLAFAGSPARVGQLLFEKIQHMPGVPELGPPPVVPVPLREVVTHYNLMDRTAAQEVSQRRLVVGMDVNAQFLAAAGSVELGTGEPVELVTLGTDWRSYLKLPGYVQLGEAVTVGPGATLAAGDWIPNPMALWLRERDGQLPFALGWFWPEHRRWLAAWVKPLRDARQALMARQDRPSRMALVAVKATYAAFLGGWLASGPDRNNYNRTDTLRPDFMHMVHGLARANAFRALAKSSHQPFASLADAFYFLVDEPTQPRGLKIDPQPGKWKRHRIGHPGGQVTIEVNGNPRTTTLAREIERGSLGNIARVVSALNDQYQSGAETA